MEVLDPELNHAFTDHYLDVEYDLSKVMFICTANVLHTIPQPLQDRMEILRLPGYTEIEKREIAKRFLIKKQREGAGLTEENLQFADDSINYIIRHYTQEAGVRNLEREIANISRKISRRVVKEGRDVKIAVTPANVSEFLGIIKFRELWAEKKNEVGIATGLAWTEVGGQVLTTEAGLMHGKGRLTLTGKLGDVMQESAQAAMSYVRSRASQLGLSPDFYRHLDIHVHIPEGAIPKDGPSAGITLATAVASALTKIAIRRDVAMTGEITLRGKVLPIGGVKEKLLAAHRAGSRTVILPRDNEKDLADIPVAIQQELSLRFVESMDEVLDLALERKIEAPPVMVPAASETPVGLEPPVLDEDRGSLTN
jgi:ATP-dependent Lon protease